MGFLGTIASSLVGGLLGGGQGQAPVQQNIAGGGGFLGGVNASSNVLGNSAVKEAVPEMEPLEERKSLGGRIKGGLRKANTALGSDAGRLATDVGQQFLGDARQARNKRKHFEYLEGKLGNPYEAAAVGGGQAGSVSPSSMASSPSSVSAGHPSQKAEARAQQVHPFSIEEARVKIDTMKFDLKNKWPMRLSQMSADNGVFGLLAYESGMDFEKILGLIPGESMESLTQLVSDYQSYQSHFRRESKGIEDYIIEKGKAIILNPSVMKEGDLLFKEGKKLFRDFGKPSNRQLYRKEFELWRNKIK